MPDGDVEGFLAIAVLQSIKKQQALGTENRVRLGLRILRRGPILRPGPILRWRRIWQRPRSLRKRNDAQQAPDGFLTSVAAERDFSSAKRGERGQGGERR